MATFAKSTFSHAGYAAFRPSYPQSIFNIAIAYHRGPRTTCLDLGCGTGMVTREMGKHFTNVIGTDPSAGMIKQARENTPAANVQYHEGNAEEGSGFLEDGSVDCVVAGQAAHWFDYARLWPEMKRIVRPGGTVAFWGYKDHVLVDYPKASAILQDYAYNKHPDKLGSYWPQPGRSYLQDKLRVIQPPEQNWEDLQRVEYEPGTHGPSSGEGKALMFKEMKVGECMEYMRTWSSYHGWQEAHPGQEARSRGGKGDVLDQMFAEMAEDSPELASFDQSIKVEWGSAIVMVRRRG